MGYFYLILQAVIFSFGGLLIKSAGTLFSPYLTSCLRFTLGIALLLVIQKIRQGKIHLTLTGWLIILGGVCKAVHYLGENFGVMRGFSYGGVLVWPVQTIVVFLIAVFVYHEKATFRTVAGTILCILGIGLISWNGAPAAVFAGSGMVTLLAFVFAGIGAALFSLAQKKLVKSMDLVEMNSSMFFYGWLVTLAVLLPTAPHVRGEVSIPAIFSMLILGAITCVGFLLQGAALKTVSVLAATIIQSSTVILTIFWGVLFYGDPLTGYVICGTILFLAGILCVNIKKQ